LGKLHVATAQLASSKNHLPALSAIAAAQEKWPMHLACQPALRVDLALTQLQVEQQNAQGAHLVMSNLSHNRDLAILALLGASQTKPIPPVSNAPLAMQLHLEKQNAQRAQMVKK